MPDLLGRLQAVLDDTYQVERELGQGGMATVYLPHDASLRPDAWLADRRGRSEW